MVKIEEVAEKVYDDRESDYVTDDDEDDFDGDSDSDVSSVASDDLDDIANETVMDRIRALKDIVAPSTRKSIVRKWESATQAAWVGSKWAGNAVWVITTSALLVGLPLALAIEDEARIVAQEKELQMQQSGQQSLMGAPAPQGEQGLVPPGF